MRVVWIVLAASGCQLAFPLELDTSSEAAPTVDGLVARYTMRIDTDGTMHDETGFEHDGVCLLPDKCPGHEPGQHGKAAAFDGIDDTVRIDQPPTLSADGFTFAFWVRADYGAPGDLTRYAAMVTMAFSDETNNSFALGLDVGDRLRMDTMRMDATLGPSNQSLTATTPFDLGVYHHVAARLSQTDKRVYVDGAQVLDQPQNNDVLYVDAPMLFGADLDNAAPMFFFHGAIDEVQFYDRVLTDSEIFQLARLLPP